VSQPSKLNAIAQVAAGVLQIVSPATGLAVLIPIGVAAYEKLKAANVKPAGGGSALEVSLIDNLIIDQADRIISSGEALLAELDKP